MACMYMPGDSLSDTLKPPIIARFRACGIVTRARPLAIAGASVMVWPPFSNAVVAVMSVVRAHGDSNARAVGGADGPCVRVVGEDDTRNPQLVDQPSSLSGGGDLHRAGALGPAFPGQQDGHRGEVRQDLVFAHICVLGPNGVRARAALV